MSDSDHQHSSTKPNEQEPSSPKHQGIINFEKCLSKLEMNLTKAIAQRRSENSRRKIERWSKDTSLPSPQASALTTSSPGMTPPTASTPNNSTQNHHQANSPSPTSSSNPGTPTTTANSGFSIEDNKIPLVEALFDLIEKNYVDSSTQIECNIPPSNMSLVPGLTTSEALSKEYGPLVRDFVQMRKRWHRARFETDSVPGSRSRASSVASSSNYAGSQVSRSTAKSGGSTFAKSKFGKSKVAPTSPVHPEQNMDDDDQQLQQQQEERPEAEVEYLRRTQEERLQRYKEIGEQANEVKTLQSDINTLVGEQQQPLDTIEKNVEKAAEKTQKGREEIFKAVKYSTFGAGLLGGVVGGLVAGPAGMLLGAQSGLAIAASTGTGAVIGGVVTHKMSNKALDGSKDAETDRAFEELKKNVGGGGSKTSAAASSSSEKK